MIYGKSGVGKFILLNFLGFIDLFDEGMVLFFGNNVLKINSKVVFLLWRNKIFYFF